MGVIIFKVLTAGLLFTLATPILNLFGIANNLHNNGSAETLDDLQPTQFFRDNIECGHKDCIITAAEYLRNMNPRVNPCDDFYEFACGNYAKYNTIADDKFSVNALSKVKDQVDADLLQILEQPVMDDDPKHFKYLKNYYKYCMDEDNIDKSGYNSIKRIFEYLGGWPVLGNDNQNSWEQVLYLLNDQGFYPNYLFTLFVDTDYVNNSIRLLSLLPPKNTLKRDALVKGIGSKHVDNYFQYMKDVVKIFGGAQDYEEQMKMVLMLEIALHNSSKSNIEISANITDLYNVFTIQQLEQIFPGFPWFQYVKSLTPSDLNISENTQIILTEPKYTKELIKILKETPKSTLINYLIWRAVFDIVPYLDSSIRTSYQRLVSNVLGSQMKAPRSTECVDNLQRLNILMGALYVRYKFDVKSRDIARDITKSVKNTFKTILKRTDWPQAERAKGIDKADAVYEQVGFSDELLEDNILDEVFGELHSNDDDYLLLNLRQIAFQRDFDFRMLLKPFDRTSWLDQRGAAEANAYYKADRNSIIVPAAILQGNYFNANLPMFLNYGAIGSVIGHEISHGFDELGHQFDKDGNLVNWWSKDAELLFQKKKKCIIEQYSDYTTDTGIKVNGNLTVNENIADFGGYKTAYISYIRWTRKNRQEPKLPGLNFTNNQMYWISAANIWCSNERPEFAKYSLLTDTHSPSKFRVNGPLSNIPMFAMDFQCPIGSKMNPRDKCTPW